MSPDHWAVSAGLVAISAIALIANALLLIVFFRRRGLRTVSNRFVINLLITNLLSSLIIIPLLLIDQELQPPPDLDAPPMNLVLKETNSSSQLTIENIPIFLEEELEATTDSITEDGFKVEFFQDNGNGLEPVRIRHVKHLLRGKNQTESVLGETDDVTFLCYLSGGSTSLVCTASILSILLIAIDQYFAVTHPLRYHTFIDKFKSLILLVSTWLISLLFGLLGAFVQTDSNAWNFCTKHSIKSDFQVGYNIFYAFTYSIVIILVPFVIICVMYGCIYCAAHRNSERMRKSNSGSSTTNLDTYIQLPLVENRLRVKVNSIDNLNIEQNRHVPKLPKVKSAPNFANFEKLRLPTTKLPCDLTRISHANSLRSNVSFMNTLKTKISNASLFKYREETRAAKISILVIFMVLVCYVPYGLTLILNTNLITEISPNHLNCISLSLLVIANLLSPFLFAYRNRRIQRELRKLFGLLPKKTGRELSIVRERNRSCSIYQAKELKELTSEPFLAQNEVPEVIVTCKVENEKKSILKRVCSKSKNWGSTKKCNFIPVPECLSADCRCSFSSASTQVSSEEYSVCN